MDWLERYQNAAYAAGCSDLHFPIVPIEDDGEGCSCKEESEEFGVEVFCGICDP